MPVYMSMNAASTSPRGVSTMLDRDDKVFRGRGVGVDCHQEAELCCSCRAKVWGRSHCYPAVYGTEDVSIPRQDKKSQRQHPLGGDVVGV